MIRKILAGGVTLALFVMGLPLASTAVNGQDEPEPKSESKDDRRGGASGFAFQKKDAQEKVRRYDEVITSKAKSDAGLFLVHRIDDKVFFEIPTTALGADMVWVTQLEKVEAGRGYAGEAAGDRVVRWEQRGDLILLRDIDYTIRAEGDDPVRGAVEATNLAPIIEAFPVRAYGKDKAAVIEVTSLFTTDVPEFSLRQRLNASGLDARRSFLEEVKSFPENIEAKALLTYRLSGDGGGSTTALVHHSMVKLPETPMKPRRYDDRVGFFTESFEDYGDMRLHQVERVRFIARWRLEKKDPKATLSEPKKPIVYYVGREVPAKWKPYVKKGVETWQVAFEAAGFKNAIIAKDAPSRSEDPDWDAEDARYSTIRWLPATIENANGPHVHDPRSGEIIEADVRMYHNVLKLARDWYFVQASPNDSRAQSLPLPDDLVGELITYVVAHEVGHTLGFPHNMKASSSYTVEQLRDPKFTQENGIEASIMDYGRFNYVAQPGDGARLIPIVGPYDKFAVDWGYREFPDAKTFDDEKKELDKIVAKQVTNPIYRFGDPNPSEDPSQQTEDLGSDALAATTLGLKNIERVAGYLVKATSRKGQNYDLLDNMYDQLVSQRNRELTHTANMVGGFVRNNVYFGDGDKVYEPVPAERQKEAVAFLVANAFAVPEYLVSPDILQRLEATGAADRILNGQRQLLGTLLSETRIKRMAELAARDPKAYSPKALLDDLRVGIFGDGKAPKTGLYARNLQRTFVEELIQEVEKPRPQSDLPALARAQLLLIVASTATTDDPVMAAHQADLNARIKIALEQRPAPAPAPAAGGLNLPPGFPRRR